MMNMTKDNIASVVLSSGGSAFGVVNEQGRIVRLAASLEDAAVEAELMTEHFGRRHGAVSVQAAVDAADDEAEADEAVREIARLRAAQRMAFAAACAKR